MQDGPLAALDAIEQATAEREVNILGFCIGGILTATTLALLAAKGDDRLKSATFLATAVRLQGGRRGPGVRRRGPDRPYGGAHSGEGLSRGPPHGRDVQPDARERPDLVVRGQQLPDGARAAAVRSSVLERRRDPPAGRDAADLSAPVLPGEPPAPAGRPRRAGRAARPRRGQDAGLHRRDQGGPHRALAVLLTRAPSCSPAPSASSSARPATSPASSTRRPPANTATGAASGCPPTRKNGSTAPSSRKAPGGPTGAPGSPARPARRSPPASPATASFPPLEDAPGSYVKVRASE